MDTHAIQNQLRQVSPIESIGKFRDGRGLVFILIVVLTGACEDDTSGPTPREIPACEPVCEDVECGADGCGGTCGTCSDEFPLCDAGLCISANCDPACASGLVCAEGVCMSAPCEPECSEGEVCIAGVCDSNVIATCDDGTCTGIIRTQLVQWPQSDCDW